MIKKYLTGLALVLCFVILFMTYKQGVNHGTSTAENSCKSQILEIQKQQQQSSNNNDKIIVQSKKMALINHNIARDELIDKL